VAERLTQDEDRALQWRQGLEHDQERQGDRLGQLDILGDIALGEDRLRQPGTRKARTSTISARSVRSQRSQASWTTSSASARLPSIRYDTETRSGRCSSNASTLMVSTDMHISSSLQRIILETMRAAEYVTLPHELTATTSHVKRALAARRQSPYWLLAAGAIDRGGEADRHGGWHRGNASQYDVTITTPGLVTRSIGGT
jgi:hypothetical protein